MFKIQTLNTISSVGLNQFPRELYEIASEIQSPDAILVRSHAMHDMTIPSSVKVIGRAGAGVNNIPIDALTKRGIPVFNTPGANANAVRELVIAGMLIASRHLCQAWNYVRHLEASGEHLEKEIEQNKKQFVGFELMGRTLGVIGLGSVGVKVANAAVNLGMRVIGYDPAISVNRAWELSANVKKAHHIEEVLMKSDFVTFHVPLTNETKHMINASRLQLVKPGVVLLNFSRDSVIDNQALAEAINEQKVFAYVTDFPHAELKNHPRVISFPHLGASTKEAEENCAVMIAQQVRDYLEIGAIGYSANFPSVETPQHHSGVRLSIVNINIPNMVAQISSKLAAAGLNILSLLNKSRNDIAYTLIDVHEDVNEQTLNAIKDIEGVVQLRRIVPVCS
ncbi:3-phosphoglycerate dehydrogenase family protein [Aquicella lusitana]|jgi:Phosphoglycerate dehydrogenase and related dehydrogenases|uniref:D-3-phosphoglycerate dehydrogenase n=1 Tax=Aquicella lusitana TaxID=254246 RepID=A0A370G5F9_9COXI|nr:3-phosphoglycerate dehydrogenase family protein [Aquicella lusitana]RDI39048.1 D-3-phosphoglycerate dehydrogenase [Aquicella lusitana]VVC73655.1 D-3-phosphoglycerate dehydrogenase [Aquicella lusitana]